MKFNNNELVMSDNHEFGEKQLTSNEQPEKTRFINGVKILNKACIAYIKNQNTENYQHAIEMTVEFIDYFCHMQNPQIKEACEAVREALENDYTAHSYPEMEQIEAIRKAVDVIEPESLELAPTGMPSNSTYRLKNKS